MPRTRIEEAMSEGTLTVSVGSRIKPDVVAQLRHYAALDDVTPSAFIAKLVTQEITRRKAAAADVS